MIFEHEIPTGSKLYFGSQAKRKRELENNASEFLSSKGFEEIVTPNFSYSGHQSIDDDRALITLNDEQNNAIIKSREELLRNISHELKTPIARGKFLIEKIKESKDQKAFEDIDCVFCDIEELVNKLLQREKLNQVSLNKTTFKVTTLILESLSKLSIDDESKVTIEIEDDFTINGDFYYLTIAFKNLIDNARGIEPKLLNNIFEPFVSTKESGGIGVGLNIAKRIIDENNAIIEAENKNNGACFTITFKNIYEL
jgi:two-component system OmpR family sensor kinase